MNPPAFLRRGVSTGSCAAAAAKAAALLLLTGQTPPSVQIQTPAGPALTLVVEHSSSDGHTACCAVRKDAGDDPDVTHGALVFASVRRCDGGIVIDGGEGIGRVTQKGLDQPVGAAAINRVPRRMITHEVSQVLSETGVTGGLSVVISIPDGVKLAQRTRNADLGITGGLSILGSTGFVEPMSHAALVETIRLELRVLAAQGRTDALLTPGSRGAVFCRDVLGLVNVEPVRCANFLGDALRAAAASGFARILLVGHIGKLCKLAVGITHTHSSQGDGRLEALTFCALRAGAELDVLHAVANCVTTEAALDVLQERGVLSPTMAELGDRIGLTLKRCVPQPVTVGFVCFSGQTILTQSENAKELLRQWSIS